MNEALLTGLAPTRRAAVEKALSGDRLTRADSLALVGASGAEHPALWRGEAVLTLAGDYAGQFLLPSRYPVGVVTGALGAPFLLYLIVRVNRSGRSL